MSVFDEIISNQELPDDMQITVGDKGSMTLGELRGLNTERTSLKTQAETAAAEAARYRGEHESLARSVAGLLDMAGKGADADEAARRAAPTDPRDSTLEGLRQLLSKGDPADALFEDKVFGSALTKVEQRAFDRAAAKIAEQDASIKELRELVTQGFTGLTNAQALEREHRWYDVNRNEIPKGQDGKRMPLEDIRRVAIERNMVIPGTRLIDYDSALNLITEPTRVEARMSEAERRGYQKGLEAGRSAAGKVLPLFGDRSAGGAGGDRISTAGKTQRQIVQERLQQGLVDLSAEEG